MPPRRSPVVRFAPFAVVAVAALAFSVGVPGIAARRPGPATPSRFSESTPGSTAPGALARARSPESTRDADWVRAALRARVNTTYLADVLRARGSALIRWPARRDRPLTVWIQPAADIPGFRPQSVARVRAAFTAWGTAGIPLAFTFVADSAAAEVHVSWIDRFPERVSGKTLWARDSHWWMVDASIVLAVHHAGGVPLDGPATHAIALHEVGHLLGLDHTGDTTAIMSPRVRARALTEADRATVRLLYALPPGPVR